MGMVGKIVVTAKTVTSSQTFADGSENILLYPNPASQSIELKFPVNYPNLNSLKVYSIAGALIDQKVSTGNSGSLHYDISRFKNGMYFLEINAGTQKNVMKFLKQ
jgi:hypothetical protein